MSAQSMQALGLANNIRITGAGWRRKVGQVDYEHGCLKLAQTLERRTTPDHIGAMRVTAFLTAANRMGLKRALDICDEASIARHYSRFQMLKIRDLTARERRDLASTLRYRAAGGHRSGG